MHDDTDDPMTPAELRVVTEWLGLRQSDVATLLDVTERTVRHWLAGRYSIPDGVRLTIEQWEASTAQAVDDVVAALNDARDVSVAIYRTDEELWAARADTKPWPAGWWRMVVARAAHEVPGVAIAYAEPPAG